jgi:uracil phosphoribosyltransferase
MEYRKSRNQKLGPKRLSFSCTRAAPEGVRGFNEKHPDVRIFGVEMDGVLDKKKYGAPGFGHFGDR